MSGGHFDYKESYFGYIADEIEDIIKNNEIEDKWGHSYSLKPETIEKLRFAIEHLRKSEQLAHDIDYMISGDYGEDNFSDGW